MVGAYSLSAELSRVSTQELIAAMNRSVYSGYSKFSEDKKSLYLNFLKVLGVQSFLIFPMGFIVAALSENVVLIILGSKWTDVIYPLSMMAMSTALVSVTSSIQYLYFVINKPRLGFYMSIVGLTIYLPQAIFMGIDKGLIGLVHAHFNTSIVMAVGNLLFVSYVFKEHVNRIITTIYRQLFSSLFTYLAISSYIKPLIESTYDSLLIASLILGVISILIYISFIFLLWVIGGKPDSAESIAISLLTSFRKRIKASV
jgi:lipopolysaccharide exporter